MFQVICEILFKIIEPIVLIVLKKTGYPKDAVLRKKAIFEESGFSKDDFVIMFHGVSVGEVMALERLVKKTRSCFPDAKIVVTTGTHTGQDIAHKKFDGTADLITYFPLDLPSIINTFLDKVNPKIIMIAETEIWPNFAIETKKRNIKLFVINGRISDKSFKTYRIFKLFFKPFLKLYTGIYTQSDDDNRKFLYLGANPETTKRMNNLKFDITKPDIDFTFNKDGAIIMLAGSTHHGEDEIVLKTFKQLRERHPGLKLILAPRHLTRRDEVTKLVEATNFKYDFRSNNRTGMEGIDILILDTLGELGKMYFFCDFAFIGGSFNKTGGHNPLEALVFNKPVISGPSIHNFRDIYGIIEKAGAGFVVKNQGKFFAIAEKFLSDKTFFQKTIESGTGVFAEQQGAMEFVLNNILTS